MLQDQLDRAEAYYDGLIIFGDGAANPQGIWHRQIRWFNVDNHNYAYFQGLYTHNLDTYPKHSATVNDDLQMQRITSTPDYQNYTWTQLWPEMAQFLFPFNLWCDQWVGRSGKGYDTHLRLQYDDVDAPDKIMQMDIRYDGTDRGKKSGWYDAPVTPQLLAETNGGDVGFNVSPQFGKLSEWRWQRTTCHQLYFKNAVGVHLTLSGVWAAGFFNQLSIDGGLVLLEADATIIPQGQATTWEWRVANPFVDNVLYQIEIE